MVLRISSFNVFAPDWIKPKGWSIHTKGYVIHTSRVVRGLNPGRGEYMHRYIVEQLLGRSLTSDEHVHHQDFNKRNNLPCNLIVMPHSLNPRSACRCPYTGKYMSANDYRERLGLVEQDIPEWVSQEFY